jgi:hypothetical protein
MMTLVILVAVAGWYLYAVNNGVNAPSAATNAKPLLTKSNSISLDYVTIPTGVNETKDYPMDGASVAQGHYLYIDTSGSIHNSNAETGGKLIYDGKTIYSGSDLATNNFAISQNGLHYEYMRYDNLSAKIYVDNKLVESIPNQPTSYAVFLYGVSNNGIDYAYSYAVGPQDIELFKDDNSIFKNTSTIENVAFNSALSHYIAVIQTTSGSNVSNKVVLDGTVLGTGIQASISNDGTHYIYIAGNNSNGVDNVIADGKNVGEVTLKDGDGDNVVINNNGSYAYTDYVNGQVIINGIADSIPATIPYDCGTSCINLFAVNQTASSYIVGDQKPITNNASSSAVWDLNGKTVNLSGDIQALEFSYISNTLYVYRWSN